MKGCLGVGSCLASDCLEGVCGSLCEDVVARVRRIEVVWLKFWWGI